MRGPHSHWRPPRASGHRLLPLAVLALTLVTPDPAAAGDDTDMMLTPWSGTAIRITDNDARFSGAFTSSLGRGLWASAEASVPMNADSNQVDLLDAYGSITGITGRTIFAYDSTWGRIGLVEGEDFKARADFCREHRIPDCTDTAIDAKIERMNDAVDDFHNLRPSADVGWHYSLGLELAGAYAGLNALANVEAEDPQIFHDYNAEASLYATGFWNSMILTLRPGVGFQQEVLAEAAQICTSQTEGDESVEVCQEQLILQGAPDAELSGHVRVAITLWDTNSRLSEDLAPGIELRTGLEGLGTDDPLLNLRLAGFLGPKIWPLGLRSGLGLEMDLAVLSDSDDVVRRVVPFAFIGATFDQVDSTRPALAE